MKESKIKEIVEKRISEWKNNRLSSVQFESTMESVPKEYEDKMQTRAYKEMETITFQKIKNTIKDDLFSLIIFDEDRENAENIINSYLSSRINLNEFYETLCIRVM